MGYAKIIQQAAGLMLALIVATTPCVGQQGPSRESFRPSFLRGDLALFVEELGLDDNRKAIVEALLFDYESVFAAAAQSARQGLEDANPTPVGSQSALRENQESMRREIQSLLADARKEAGQLDDPEARRAVMDEYHKKVMELREEMRARRTKQQQGPEAVARREAVAALMVAWNQERQRLRDDLVTNIAAVLTDEQRARWPGVMQTVHRRELLGGGMLAGESVDLIALFRRLRIERTSAEPAAPVLAEYAQRLDEALVAHRELIESFGGRASTVAEVQQEIGMRVAVRDVNVAFAGQVAGTLPGSERSRFVDAYHLEAFPSVYRPTPVQRLFSSTKGRRSLTEEQRSEVGVLEQEYVDALVSLNAAVRDATLAYEAEQLRERLAGRLGEKPPAIVAPSDNPIRQAMARRREAGTEYTERLQSMLGDVRTAYPKQRPSGARD